MKRLFWLYIAAFTFINCNKSTEPTPFDYTKAAGIWVPYELVDEMRVSQNGPFTANNIFGSYAESVQFNSDQTYIPVTWINKDNFTLKTSEKGVYTYSQGYKISFKGGLFEIQGEVSRFENDELWLKMLHPSGGVLYKFKRTK